MGRIRSLQLKKSLFMYLVLFLSIGIVLSLFTIRIFDRIEEDIWIRNLKNVDDYTEWQIEYREEFGDYLPVPTTALYKLSHHDRILKEICDFGQTWSQFFWAFGSALVVVFVFYNNKLKKPLKLLNYSAHEIENSNLNFCVSYDKEDEMGELCDAFEKMRVQLVENNSCMWKMVEEQKQLRAAFTHDIRAPLAVLKGYVQLLLRGISEKKFSCQKQMEMLQDIEEQVERLEEFSDSVKKVQKIDSINIIKEKSTIETLYSKIRKTLSLLRKDPGIEIKYGYQCNDTDSINIDINIVLEIVENIFVNAVRYAKSEISLKMKIKNSRELDIIISDDGMGFSEKDMFNACKPYYHDNSDDNIHFGIGLYICKILSEKHGGRIDLYNNESGGASVQVTINIE